MMGRTVTMEGAVEEAVIFSVLLTVVVGLL